MRLMIRYTMFVLAICFALSSRAQFDPDKICRIDNGQLVFTINLKWTEKEKKELTNLFDLDSVLVSQVFAGKTAIVLDGETWVVKKGKFPMVELSKPVQSAGNTGVRISDVFMVIDQWMSFAGNVDETPATWGVNNFEVANAFVYRSGRAWFYLPGYKDARKVYIAGSFNDWSTNQTPMKPSGNGWSIELPLKPGKYTYKFIVDGRWMTDPSNRQRETTGAETTIQWFIVPIISLC